MYFNCHKQNDETRAKMRRFHVPHLVLIAVVEALSVYFASVCWDTLSFVLHYKNLHVVELFWRPQGLRAPC